jgi:hypothetical protein
MANMSAPDLSSEINAASSVVVSCYLYGDLNPTVTTNKGEAPRRLCTTQVFQQFGNTTYEVPDLQYVYTPQAATSTSNNKAVASLTEGSERLPRHSTRPERSDRRSRLSASTWTRGTSASAPRTGPRPATENLTSIR